MIDGIQIQETPELTQKSREVSEVKKQIDQAAFAPEEAVEEGNNYEEAEAIEEAVKEVMEVAPVLEYSPEITLEGAEREGRVTITNPIEAQVTTEPLKDSPIEAEITTESPETPPSEAQLISALLERLPEDSDSFTNQAVVDILQEITEEGSEDPVSQTRASIQSQFGDIPLEQSDGLLAATLLKAAQALESITAENPDQPVDPKAGFGIKPSLTGNNLIDDPGRLDTQNGGGPSSENEGSGKNDQETERDQLGDDSQLLLYQLQNTMSKNAQFIAILTTIMKRMNDTASEIIQNLK